MSFALTLIYDFVFTKFSHSYYIKASSLSGVNEAKKKTRICHLATQLGDLVGLCSFSSFKFLSISSCI